MKAVAAPPPPPIESPDELQVRIGPLDRVTMNSAPYGRAQLIDGVGYVLHRLDVSPPLPETFTFRRLQEERDKPGYSFDRNWFTAEKAVVRERTSLERLSDLEDAELPKVMFKLEWVTRFLTHEIQGTANRSNDSLKEIIPIIQAEVHDLDVAKMRPPGGSKRRPRAFTAGPVPRKPPCERTLWEWVTKYERSGFNPCVLRDNTDACGNRTMKIDVKIALLTWRYAVQFAQPHRPTRKKLYGDLCDAIDLLPENAEAKKNGLPLVLPYPSRKLFKKTIDKLDKYDVFAGRYGIPAAKKKFAMIAAGLDVTRPFQRIEIDEWRVSLMVLLVDAGLWEYLTPEQQELLKPIRMWLCAAIDCATRCIVGMRLSHSASSENALAVLRMMVSDKSGYASFVGAKTPWDMRASPESVVSDSGSSFIADVTQVAIVDLSGAPKIPPVDLAHFRARIERLFGTVHTALIARFHGRTFGNVVDLGDYDPMKMANLKPEQLAWALVRFVVDAYHNLPHEGLGGETPRNAWIRLTKEFRIIEPPDRDKIRAIFGLRLIRTLRAGGIHILGLNYNSVELEAHRRRVGDGVDLDVRLDAEDIGAISVKLGRDWLSVPCVRRGFDKVSLQAWLGTLADLRLRFAHEAAIDEPIAREALRAIQQLSDEAQAQAGISKLIPSVKQIEQAEEGLVISFNWVKPDAEDAVSSGAGLFDGAIPAGGHDDPQADAPSETKPDQAPTKPTRPRSFRMED